MILYLDMVAPFFLHQSGMLSGFIAPVMAA